MLQSEKPYNIAVDKVIENVKEKSEIEINNKQKKGNENRRSLTYAEVVKLNNKKKAMEEKKHQ